MNCVDGFVLAVPTAHREADPRLKPTGTPMPFDGKRMICGGFTVLVSA